MKSFAVFVIFATLFSSILGKYTEDDIKKWSVKELREFLDKKGVPCKDCVQKEDFVEIALSIKDHSDVEHSSSKVEPESREQTTNSENLKKKAWTDYLNAASKIMTTNGSKILVYLVQKYDEVSPILKSKSKAAINWFIQTGGAFMRRAKLNSAIYGKKSANICREYILAAAKQTRYFGNRFIDRLIAYLDHE